MKLVLLLFYSFFILLGCTPPAITESDSNPSADYCADAGFSTGSEVSTCATDFNYTSPAVVSGTAAFYKRNLIVSVGAGPAVTNLELGAPISSPLPIKYAEIRVTNNSGTVVQCGKTDSTGALKDINGTSDLELPNVSGTYTVQVLARSNHNVSVGSGKPAFRFNTAVKSVCTNDVHSISSNISVTGTGTYNTSLLAYARESQSSVVAGGAFNIYNSLSTSYDYLASNTASSDLSCLDSKFSVFWNAGFNPLQLIYPDEDPSTLSTASFYLRGFNELYINGGKLGNVSSEDTDHFDDTVIIHELGHRIEDVCSKLDSPGGQHFGQFRIDPRLAWSEGWGNFLSAHIIRNNITNINPELVAPLASTDGWLYYLDTVGYTDGAVTTGSELIRFNLARNGTIDSGNNVDAQELFSGGFAYDNVSSTVYPGEGHFREVSIARSLFKSTNSCANGNCVNTNYFDRFWKAFEKISSGIGMGKSIYPFRSSVRFYERLEAVFVGALPAPILNILNNDEAQQKHDSGDYIESAGPNYKTWVPYGTKLVSNGGTICYLKIEPREEFETITYSFSDQRYSSHFYYFDRASLNPGTITLTATKAGVGSNTNVDIDLILYQDGYSFPTETCGNSGCSFYTKNTTSSEFVRSDRSIASNISGTYTKQITNLSSLGSSTPYLLNIRAYTANLTINNAAAYTYTLTDGTGNYLCPTSDY